jgi:hypothetical protein
VHAFDQAPENDCAQARAYPNNQGREQDDA